MCSVSVEFVRAHKNYMLECIFDTGEIKMFDMKPYLESQPALFENIKDNPDAFEKVYAMGAPVWDEDTDIAASCVYDNGILIGYANITYLKNETKNVYECS
jgi:hypothetical protein